MAARLDTDLGNQYPALRTHHDAPAISCSTCLAHGPASSAKRPRLQAPGPNSSPCSCSGASCARRWSSGLMMRWRWRCGASRWTWLRTCSWILRAVAVVHDHGPTAIAAFEERLKVTREGQMVAIVEEGSRTGKIAEVAVLPPAGPMRSASSSACESPTRTSLATQRRSAGPERYRARRASRRRRLRSARTSCASSATQQPTVRDQRHRERRGGRARACAFAACASGAGGGGELLALAGAAPVATAAEPGRRERRSPGAYDPGDLSSI